MSPGTKGSSSSNRGFASMDEEKQREIASKGGQAAHEKGSAHEFTSEEARNAGQKGGQSVSQDREHMAEIGRKGGESSHSGGKSAPGSSSGSSTHGGTSGQHAKAGSKSHKKR